MSNVNRLSFERDIFSDEDTQKLFDIINTLDVSKAYVGLIKDIKDEFARELRDKAVYGESI